jgi:phage protein D
MMVAVEEAEVTQSKTKKSDTFSAKFPTTNGIAAFLASADPTQLEAQVIINGAPLCDGLIDHIDVEWDTTTVSVSGRDKAAKLIDSLSSEKFLNQPPSKIVQTIAGRRGLSAEVDSGSDLAGKIFKDTWDSITHRNSEWSVIQWLGDHFGMNAYMTGGKVYFKDVDEQLQAFNVFYTPPTSGGYATSNVMILQTTRNVILGRPVKTNVLSRHDKQKKTFTAKEEKSGSGDPLIYNYVLPRATQDQVKRIAKKKHRENTRHEFSVRIDMPGDESVNVRMGLQLTGTGSAFDRLYEMDSVQHKISSTGGYTMTLEGKSGKSAGGGS